MPVVEGNVMVAFPLVIVEIDGAVSVLLVSVSVPVNVAHPVKSGISLVVASVPVDDGNVKVALPLVIVEIDGAVSVLLVSVSVPLVLLVSYW